MQFFSIEFSDYISGFDVDALMLTFGLGEDISKSTDYREYIAG